MPRISVVQVCVALSLGSALGCGPEPISLLPELQYEGEHVRVGTDFEIPICAGNLADFDHEIERLDKTLELDSEGKTDLWILADRSLYNLFCPAETRGCEAWEAAGGALLRKRAPDVLWHTLAHDRLVRANKSQLASSSGLFVEGMSEALARAYCEPTGPWEQALPSADSLLEPDADHHASFAFSDVSLAGQLLRWMIQTHGPQQTQTFMVGVDRDDPPDMVRAAYSAQFGSSIDEDLYAHIEWSVADRHPYEIGCRGEPAPSEADGVYDLQATLDCSSKLVRSNFYEHRPEKLGDGYVEWAVKVETAGYHALVGELPPNTELSIARCDCQALDSGYWPGADPTNARPFAGEQLTPGLYRVVWKGPLDSDHVLNVQIVRS